MKSYCNSDSFMFHPSTLGSPGARLLGMGMWERSRGVKEGNRAWRRQSACFLLYSVSSFPVEPHRRRQLCVIELAEEPWREGSAGECN